MTEQDQHARFASDCFNGVWDLLGKAGRTPDEDRLMREMAHASLFHWLCREDGTAKNLSIGLWQISRVHAVLGNGAEAMRYAEECMGVSNASGLPPFFRGYAHEAAARAAFRCGDFGRFRDHLRLAGDMAKAIEDEDERGMLEADLAELANLRAT